MLFWLSLIVLIGMTYLRLANWYDEKMDYKKALDDIQHRRAKLELQESLEKFKEKRQIENLNNESETHD